MNTQSHRLALAGIALLATGLLAACGNDRPETHIASARSYLDKGESKAAVIELKTALQLQGNSPEARFLLGKALLAGEEPVAAEIELRKALDLKYPRSAVAPILARALLAEGKHKELIDEFGGVDLEDKRALAGLKTTLAWAYFQSGQLPRADDAFKQALAAAPEHVPAKVGQARLLAVQGDRDAARKIVDGIIAAGAADADTWVLRGDLAASVESDRDSAIEAYRKAIALQGANLAAHAGIIALQLSSKDLKGATEQVAALQKARPGHLMTGYFQAQLAYDKRDLKSAKELVAQLLKVAPNHPQVNQLAGAVELASGSVAVARVHLGKTLQAIPNSNAARGMMAASYLKSGEPSKALEFLEPMLALPGSAMSDGNVFALAGEAYMQIGDLDKASAMFSRATQINPGSVASQTALARTRFLKGDTVGALADLQRIAASDTGTVADLELVNTQLRQHDFQGALKSIEQLQRKSPNLPATWLLRGAAFAGLKDTAMARESLEKALALDPVFFPAAFNLAALDLAEKKPEAAQRRFESIIKAQPGHLSALLALADLRARTGASKQAVTELLTTAVRLNPAQASAHLSLINYLLSTGQNEAAITAAQQADAALAGQQAIADALGRAQFAAGKHDQALQTFSRIVAKNPDDAIAHVHIAEVHLAMKNTNAAIQSLKRAVAAKPDSAVALQRLSALEIAGGLTSDALQLARDLQRRYPAYGLGFVLEGDALLAQKSNGAALAAYRVALGKAAPGDAPTKYFSLLMSGGKKVEAQAFATGWVKDHSNDIPFAIYLGDSALARSDMAAALAAYRHVVDVQPNQVAALNNIAWLMVKTGEPGALPFAEKANSLAPNQPALLDTLAMTLAAEKQLERAVEIEKSAFALAPDNNTIRLGLARLHLQSGQKEQARDLLEPLIQLGERFAEHAEVKRLSAGL